MALTKTIENKATGGDVTYHIPTSLSVSKTLDGSYACNVAFPSFISEAERNGEGRSTQREIVPVTIDATKWNEILTVLDIYTVAKATDTFDGATDA